MKKISLFLALLATALTVVSCLSMGKTTSEIIITQEVKEDATRELYGLLMQSKQENVTIRFEEGEYHFYPEYGFEKYCQMSNHSDWLSRIAFPIIGRKALTIDGGGSKFIIHGRMIPFWIEDCDNVVVKNLTIDFAESFHSEMVVKNINKKAKYIDFEISEEYPYEIRNGKLIFTKTYYEHSMDYGFVFDGASRKPAFGNSAMLWVSGGKKLDAIGYREVALAADLHPSDDFTRERGKQSPYRAEKLSDGVVRLHECKINLKKGWIVACKGNNGINRFAPGIRGANSKDVVIEDVTLHHAAGMGYLFEQCTNVTLNRCKGVPSEGRIVSVTADATHFVGCRGKVMVKDCIFTNQLDDGLNLHGAYQKVVKILDSHTIGVRMGHYQQLGYMVGTIGDKIGFIDIDKSMIPYCSKTIESIENINGRYLEITFKEELPKELALNHAIDNLSAVPELWVEGCTFKDSRAHAILISTPIKSTIINNYFSTQMGAILMPAIYNEYWCESGEAHNVLIENNIFEDCSVVKKQTGLIEFVTKNDSKEYLFSNIKILNNTFNHYDNFILNAMGVDGLTFEGNTIKNSGTFPQLEPNLPMARVENCRDVKIENNNYSGKAKILVEEL